MSTYIQNLKPRYCSQCAASLIFKWIEAEKTNRFFCEACQMIHYLNPKPVAAAVIFKEGKVILFRRGIDARKGYWAFPGGFLELHETVAQGVVREAKEEVGVDIHLTQLLGVYSYSDSDIITIVYLAEIVGGVLTETSEAYDIRSFSIDEIPWDDLAFRSIHDALTDFIKLQKTHQ